MFIHIISEHFVKYYRFQYPSLLLVPYSSDNFADHSENVAG